MLTSSIYMMLLRHLSVFVLFGAHKFIILMTLDLLVYCDSHPMRKKSSRVFVVIVNL